MRLLLVLPLGLGWALLPPGRGDSSAVCELCHSPHRARAQANGTLGASVTLGCPAAGAPLGRLLAEHWHFWGDPASAAATVCSRSRAGPRCEPPYGHRARLLGTAGTPGGLELRRLRPEDAGTYSCLLLGEEECACGELTLRLGGDTRTRAREGCCGAGLPCSAPCSGGPPTRGRAFGLTLLLILLLLLLPPSPEP